MTIMKKPPAPSPNPVLFAVLINIVCLIFSPIILFAVVSCSILYALTDIFLKLKHGKLYGGLLSSGDSIWKSEGNSRAVINICCIVNAESENPTNLIRDLRATIQRRVFDDPETFPKFNVICRSFLGYGYLLKSNLTTEDCITVADTSNLPDNYLNEDGLTKFISSYGNRALPKNHEALWELVIMPKPILWNENVKRGTQFAILFRFNHILGDGFTVTNHLMKILCIDGDKYLGSFKKSLCKILPTKKIGPIRQLDKFIEIMTKFIYIFCNCAPNIVYQLFLREEDENILHGPELTREKHLVFAVEKEEGLLSIVKDIKKRIKNTSFSTILFTAFSASLNRYFDKLSAACPDYVYVIILAMKMQPQADGSLAGPDNKHTLGFLNLPVNTGSDLIHRLQNVEKNFRILSNAPDFLVNDIMLNKVMGILPVPFTKGVLSTNKQTCSISIVPGLPEKFKAHGFVVQDVIFYTPQNGKAGIGLCIMTYDNRFQVGLIVDKAIIPDVKDAQSIVDDIFGQVHELHAAVAASYK